MNEVRTTIPPAQQSTESIDFELVYSGPEVDDGTVRTRDLINALTGMYETFSRIASEDESLFPYELRVRDIAPGSVEILFRVIEFAKANPGPTASLAAVGAVIVTATSNSLSGLYRVITDLAKIIEAKIQLRGDRVAKVKAEFSDKAVILLLPSGPLELTKEQYELLLSQRVDSQLAKMVSPLNPGQINSMTLRQGGQELAKVNVEDRSFFDHIVVAEGERKEGTTIEGTLNSLNKTSLKGTFHTTDGVHVPYRYLGGDIGQLLRGFSAREAVRVHGKVKYDSDGTPTSIEVQTIESLQTSFFQ